MTSRRNEFVALDAADCKQSLNGTARLYSPTLVLDLRRHTETT